LGSAEARARLERVQQVARRIDDPAALSESLQSQVIANLRSEYTETARVEAEYRALFGSRYPGLVAVRAQLADIRRQIEHPGRPGCRPLFQDGKSWLGRQDSNLQMMQRTGSKAANNDNIDGVSIKLRWHFPAGIKLAAAVRSTSRAVQAVGRIVANPHLGGLHHQYVRI